MSITKALAALYKSISGNESKHKNNVTKLLADIYGAITGSSTNKNNPSKIINDLASNWPAYPVSSVTVSGSLNDMFGDVSLSDLHTALKEHNASAYLEADATALSMGTIHNVVQADGSGDGALFYADGASIEDSVVSAFIATWAANGTLTSSIVSVGETVTDISTYASAVTTDLTIVWHPQRTS